ncbi:MAG: CBS domain-containing protein [Rhodanobacter sp.]
MSYRPLNVLPAQAATSLPREKLARSNEWEDSDSATLLMTDFRDSFPPVIAAGNNLGDAAIEMQRFAASSLVATDGNGVVGIITLRDIHGPKPVQFLHDVGCHLNCRRQDVTVADVMTPVEQLPAVRLADLQRSRIGDIRKTFENSTHTHLMVLDDDSVSGLDVICGMIEGERLEREVGLPTTGHTASVRRFDSLSREPLLS